MQQLIKKYNISKSFFNRYFELNAINRLGYEMSQFIHFKKGKFINPLKKDEYIQKYIAKEIENFFNKSELNIPQIEFCLTTRCTLKCKDCCALMPLFNSERTHHIDMTIEEFQKTIRQLTENVNCIRKLIILGGEPLLNPKITQMLEYAASINNIHQISIVSNGTIVPNTNIINTLKNSNKIFFYMSNYAQNSNLAPILKYDKIKSVLKENGLKYQILENWNWFKEYGFSKTKSDKNDSKNRFNNCYRTKCLQTLDRKIDICSKAFTGRNLSLINTKDYIDLETTKNLKQDLINFYKKELIDACEYCIISKEEVQPALQ